MATVTDSQNKLLNAEEVEQILEETAKKERRLNEERRRFEIKREQFYDELNNGHRQLTDGMERLKTQMLQLQKVKEEAQPESDNSRPLDIPPSSISNHSTLPQKFPIHSFSKLSEYLETIPKFDGYNMSVHTFTKSCEQVTNKLQKYPAKEIINRLKFRLSGYAYKLLDDIDFQTVDAFIKYINDFFLQLKRLKEYMEELGALRQRRNETVEQYACRTKELENVLIHSIKYSILNTSNYLIEETKKDILNRFLIGLNDVIRLRLQISECRDLDEAILQATMLERDYGITYTHRQNDYNRNNDSRYTRQEHNRGNRYHNSKYNNNSRPGQYFNESPNFYRQNSPLRRNSYTRYSENRYNTYSPLNNYDSNRFNYPRYVYSSPSHYDYNRFNNQSKDEINPIYTQSELPGQSRITTEPPVFTRNPSIQLSFRPMKFLHAGQTNDSGQDASTFEEESILEVGKSECDQATSVVDKKQSIEQGEKKELKHESATPSPFKEKKRINKNNFSIKERIDTGKIDREVSNKSSYENEINGKEFIREKLDTEQIDDSSLESEEELEDSEFDTELEDEIDYEEFCSILNEIAIDDECLIFQNNNQKYTIMGDREINQIKMDTLLSLLKIDNLGEKEKSQKGQLLGENSDDVTVPIQPRSPPSILKTDHVQHENSKIVAPFNTRSKCDVLSSSHHENEQHITSPSRKKPTNENEASNEEPGTHEFLDLTFTTIETSPPLSPLPTRSPTPSSSRSSDTDEPDQCALPRPLALSSLFKLIDSRDCLKNRKDNLVIFISYQGKPLDKGALELHENKMLPVYEDIMSERAKVTNVTQEKKLISLPIDYPLQKQSIIVALKSLFDVVAELGIKSISISKTKFINQLPPSSSSIIDDIWGELLYSEFFDWWINAMVRTAVKITLAASTDPLNGEILGKWLENAAENSRVGLLILD
ncbi:hypothetical protein M0804_013727 [Polistes exclamans]|nr:hypothetical protein M0804_013727 [Polistes exclamans]